MTPQKRKITDDSSGDVSAGARPQSIISSSEIAFPRGGASVLTPLEIKEVANEAARDILFETKTDVSKDAEGPPAAKKKKLAVAKRAKKKSSLSTSGVPTLGEKKSIEVENFNLKTLTPGTTILGQISQINKMEICLALTDNITGFIPITAISEEITSLLEKFQEEQEQEEKNAFDDDGDDDQQQEEEEEENTTSELPDLRNYFKIGQWLRALVVEDSNSNSGKINKTIKKRIQLTIEPEQVNKFLEIDDLVLNATLQVSITSIEDHGAILNTGMDDKKGFISKKELISGGVDVDSLKIGSVLLTSIAKNVANSRTITCKIPSGSSKKTGTITTISSVDSIVAGPLVEAIITEVKHNGLICKVFGLCDATINFTHAHAFEFNALKHKFAIGSNIKARVLSSQLKNGERKLTLSILPHILALTPTAWDPKTESAPLEAFAIGHVFDEVEINGHDSNYIYANVGNKSVLGQAHVSRISEKESVDVEYKIGTKHKARVLGYSLVDNFYILTFDKKQIAQTYLRSEDIPVGILCQAEILKVIPESGISLRVFDKFDAYVPKAHMSDIKLIYPERKFKIGAKVKGRVLKITHPKAGKTNVMVTFKKSLVGADDEDIIASWEDAEEGKRTPATVEKIQPNGCIVSFFGNVKAFLPKSEISETFVKNPEDHLRLGQTINVRILNVDKENKKLRVSCRVSSTLSAAQKDAITELIPGKSIVDVVIVEKEKNSVIVELPDSNLRGVISAGHLSDGNIEQNRALLKKLEIGKILPKVLALEKDTKSRVITLSGKKSLVDFVRSGNVLPSSFKEISVSETVFPGYIRSITDSGVFVGFANRLTGLALTKYIEKDENLYIHKSVSVRIIRLDNDKKRFLVSMKELKVDSNAEMAVNPVDTRIKNLDEFVPGVLTKAIIKSVKSTQLNVELADNLQGRIDISQIFDNLSEITDKKHPLSQFKKDQVLNVKIIGYHDARNHRFLPISHRNNKNLVLELSAKKSDLVESKVYKPLTLSDTKIGTKWIAFINNFARSYLWVNISPTIRGRISLMSLSDDASTFEDLDKNYPLGSALEVTVEEVDTEHNAVTLSSRPNPILSSKDVKVGQVVPSRVLKTKDNYVLVELGKDVTAVSFVTDALNDYTEKLESIFSTNDICVATILEVDHENNKIAVSLRTKDAKDRPISSINDLKSGDIVRGFIKNVTSKGVFVSLGREIYGYVRVSDLSDSYIKDWNKFFKPHQAVACRIISAEEEGRILLSLKASEVSGEANPLKRFEDLKVGEIYEGYVKKATDFGVFVKLDGTSNVDGLCHHSEISDNKIENIQALFGEGDRVKVKILKINPEKKQLSLGMKASYFTDSEKDNDEDGEEGKISSEEFEQDAENSEEEEEDEDEASEEDDKDDEDEEGDQVMKDAFENDNSESESGSDDEEEETSFSNTVSAGLSTNGFDWTASILDQVAAGEESSDEEEDFTSDKKSKKDRKKKNKSTIVEDKTVDLNTRAPQSVADFERLLLGNPSSSILWMNYMSFQLQLSEVDKAREIGERALKTINYRDEQEKMNIWIALLNLENTFGSEDTLEELFKRSCQYMDSLTMHQKLSGIYILSEKFDKADELFKKMLKKFNKHTVVWFSYGSFLIDQHKQEECRQILSSALQILPKRDHIEIVRKFAQLEFNKGDPEQGRSLFEGLIADVPKRIDIWNVYIDQEIKLDKEDGNDGKKKIEELFERVLNLKKISKKQAKFFFRKWLEFEENKKDLKACDYVKAKAVEYQSRFSGNEE
ncbi:hypothetical protein PACTADRAFT_50207 [Pachysolen tannophilus NRRL Y-2460]|uniref:S1 motif domain-containing protein n=1 Tax=Pachysolen tannophilus NRRL Y-2460 TaxID=669874 RepID=A0A1E4TUP8_PACTA|nr:hypothetical protein PACTADRAFT_50207 [Pachysolen tannophilus NRRL Y-2460]